MSTLALDRTYQLQVPSSYVDIDSEEMEYVEGGAYLSGSQCINICAALMMTGSAMVAAAATVAVATKIFRYATIIGGPVGWIIKAVAGLAIAALCKIAYGIGYGAISKKGVYIETSPWPWESFVTVHN